MPVYIAKELREQIREDAGNRCGYCLSSKKISGLALQFEHLCPESAGGKTERENLWLACSRCNSHKSDREFAIDSESGEEFRLFNPRRDDWEGHFMWIDGDAKILGKTPIGRATVEALQMNGPLIVAAKKLWVQWNMHPPG